MRSIFLDGGTFGGARFAPALAQARGIPFLQDILETVGLDEERINELLDKIPKESLGVYQKKLDDCRAKGVTTGGGALCLYQLFQELKDVVEGRRPAERPAAAAPPRPRAPEDGFPIIPVAIAGVVVAGLVVFLATRG
jgi:hypothetical protein